MVRDLQAWLDQSWESGSDQVGVCPPLHPTSRTIGPSTRMRSACLSKHQSPSS